MVRAEGKALYDVDVVRNSWIPLRLAAVLCALAAFTL
jgi:hypothetical protein